MMDIEPVYRQLGLLFMAFRHEGGMSQEEAADFLGLTRTSVTNIEAGRQRVMLHTLIDMAFLMMIEPGDLLNRAMERVREES
jgi:DNA-binding XRE family transcriptional regulator